MTDRKNQASKSAHRSSKWAVIALPIVPLAMFLAAAIWLYVPGAEYPDTTNIGHLIKPVKSVAELSEDLSSADWNIMVLVKGDCDEQCKNRLAVVRNAHWALGKEAGRVHRSVLLLDVVEQPDALFRKNFPALRIINLPLSQFNEWRLDVASIITDPFHLGVIVVDPLGYAFIYYDTEQTGNHIIRDMRKLLRYSRL